MDSLLFFLLAHMVLADHRSTVGGGGELRTTNAEHLIFATEECIMKMHCGPILRTTRRYCTMRNECVGDRQDDGSCVEITTQLNSTTIGDHNFCDHQPPSKQKQRTCNKLIKFIHGIKCKEVSPSIESNRVNVGKLERSTRREANSVRRLQFDDSVEQMRPNSIRTMSPVMDDDDVTDDEVKKSGPMAEKMEMVAAHIMANDDKDDDNDDDITDDGHVKAMDYLSKNHASRTSSPVTARIKTTTYNDNPHHLPEGTFLFVGIFSAMLLMIVIFALVLCRSRHTDNLVSELYAGGGKPPVTQQQQQQETTSSSTRRKQQSDHRVDAIVNNNNKNNKKNDHVFREEVLR